MEKQVKINIKNKDYYCDSEIFKYIMRLQDKVELLEYNRDKAIDLLVEYFCSMDYTACEYKYVCEVLGRLQRILENTEY